MDSAPNTLLLRLAGPMQSWGTGSRFQLRRTDLIPSKSGVLGLILCTQGVSRADSPDALAALNGLRMGVRVDRPGHTAWDYHTVGAKVGIRKAEGGIKITGSTKEVETLLSRRQYLWDASFLVALHGDPSLIKEAALALEAPAWPIFLGRKCCIPGEPVLVGTCTSDSLDEALATVSWRPRTWTSDAHLLPRDRSESLTLPTFIEHRPGSRPPSAARLSHDVATVFGFWGYQPRWVVPGEVVVPVGEPTHGRPVCAPRRRPNYGSAQWLAARRSRLEHDLYRCVLCGQPATEVHHVHYETVGHERDDDLRSLCDTCHDACTMMEYGRGMQARRVDPLDPAMQPEVWAQVERIRRERQRGATARLMRRLRKHDAR